MDIKPIDVFISHHTKSCLKITEAICNSLESLGIRVWYAPRDTQDEYARKIVEVINECKVFILVLNHESSESYDVLNEINCVAERLRNKQAVHVIPFQISNEDISDNAKYYIGRMHWLDAVTPPIEKRIKELTDRVEAILKNNQNIIPEYKDKNAIKINSTYVSENVQFIGRKKEIEEVKNALDRYKKVFLKGIGGIGKSEIAKKYISMYKENYDIIIFARYTINLEQLIISEKNFNISNFYRIQNDNGIIENDREFFLRKLDLIKEFAKTKKMLIVIDNFDTEDDENLEEILNGEYDVIFTTRYSHEYLGVPTIEINAMDNTHDLYNLFVQNYNIHQNVNEKEEIIDIIRLLQGHTLAIELVSKYMKSSRKRPKDMYNIIKENGINPNLSGQINHFFEKNTMYQYIKMLFDISKINEEEKYVLMNLSLFTITGIEFGLFIELCNLQDGFVIDDLIKKSWISYSINEDTIHLHPLIIDVIKNECKPDLKVCNILFTNLTKIDSWKISQHERIKYEGIILNIYHNFTYITKENVNKYIEVAKFLRDLGYYKQSEELLLKILDVQIKEKR